MGVSGGNSPGLVICAVVGLKLCIEPGCNDSSKTYPYSRGLAGLYIVDVGGLEAGGDDPCRVPDPTGRQATPQSKISGPVSPQGIVTQSNDVCHPEALWNVQDRARPHVSDQL